MPSSSRDSHLTGSKCLGETVEGLGSDPALSCPYSRALELGKLTPRLLELVGLMNESPMVAPVLVGIPNVLGVDVRIRVHFNGGFYRCPLRIAEGTRSLGLRKRSRTRAVWASLNQSLLCHSVFLPSALASIGVSIRVGLLSRSLEHKVQEGDVILSGGWPGSLRRDTDGMPHIEHSPYSIAAVAVTLATPDRFRVRLNRADLSPAFGQRPWDDKDFDFGGMSGAPVLRRNAINYELVGVISEYQGPPIDTFAMTNIDIIKSDGTLWHNARR
jgi:hypothetical protein